MPAALETRAITLLSPVPLALRTLAQRLADRAGVAVSMEDRPARDGRAVDLPAPPRLSGDWSGGLREALDGLSAAAGYDWEWDGPRRTIEFFRYRDAAGARAAQGADGGALRWTVDPDRHKTLGGVVRAWARRAGWHVVWAAPDYAVTTTAVFEGGFTDAVGRLLAATEAAETPLAPTAWPMNRQLVIRARR